LRVSEFIIMKKFGIRFIVCFCFGCFNAQVISLSPSFPTIDDEVTVVFDASKGNAALSGVSPVYAHTGVITTINNNWQFTQGNWGTADANVLMQSLGNNLHSITYNIRDFYGFPQQTELRSLAFVFRNATGNIVGRDQGGSDIFYPIYPNNGELFAKFFRPSSTVLLNLNDDLEIFAEANLNANLKLYQDGQLLAEVDGQKEISYLLTANEQGNHMLELVADNGQFEKRDTVYYVVNPNITVLNPPSGIVNGINYTSNTSVILQLYAPEKQNIYVIGDFNNWMVNSDYHMYRSSDNASWWIEINNLTPNQRYGFQYLIDGTIRIADPLSHLILDPNNDNAISAQTYPNPHPYPTGKTTGFVSIIQPSATPFNWQHDDFVMPEKKDLIIYELLVRDFVHAKNYLTIIDSLDYLQKLGINAIELMPVGEFENNESWGYNPSFHIALDKFYGTPEHFKMFVDECHRRGIAVILDIVLNHTFGQSPMLAMYWDAANQRPAENNPWFNPICPHEPFCWGYDLNHEVQATKDYIDIVNKFWLEEYHLDGFRFDYTKGFVNNANGYSDTRIDILKRMADKIWEVKSDAYVILEHWADNNEEKQLSDYGMMLWGNIHYHYLQAGMGYTANSNLSNGIYSSRGWNDPHLITYIESHDEERLMYEMLNFGNTTNPEHNVKEISTALQRAQTAAVLMLTTPGPKMIWQFGELGYDISIDNPCRVCNKPILWNYYTQANRKQLYDVYCATIKLRNDYSTFRSLNFQASLGGAAKRIILNDPDMNAVVLANFAVINQSVTPNFQSTGWWYEYFTGDSINVSIVTEQLSLKPAEYRIYTDKKIQKPEILSTASYEELSLSSFELNLYPVPANEVLNLEVGLLESQNLNVKIIDASGKVVLNENKSFYTTEGNSFSLNISKLQSGSYHVLIESENGFSNKMFYKE
jgi:glycosidase